MQEPDTPRRRSRALAGLNRLHYFVAVVDAGSFTRAAERLGVTKAVVSQQVALLEAECNATLLARSPRGVAPTGAGREFHQHCRAMLDIAEDALDALDETAQTFSGRLTITAPLDYGLRVVLPAIAAFKRLHPACTIDSSITDDRIAIAGGSVDVAIRAGWLTEPNVQARTLASFRQLVVSAPDTAWQAQSVSHPSDLLALPFIANTSLRQHSQWTFTQGDGSQSVTLAPGLLFDATMAVLEATRAGLGFSILPDYVVQDDIAQGRLVALMPGWQLPDGFIYAAFPSARFRSARTRAFVDVLAGIARG